MNGQAHGSVAQRLLASGGDPAMLRPWVGADGRSYISCLNQRTGKREAVVTNAPTTLRKDDWKLIDDVVLRVARQRLKAFADLRARGNTLTIPNGMAKTVLEYETMGDISGATISMDGVRKAEADRPEFGLGNMPLPIIHKDFHFTLRNVLTSRGGGTPIDTAMVELATRKVTEEVEKLTLGIAASYSYGGGTLYGYTNFPSRNTKVMTLPTALGWTPATTVAEVLAMRAQAQADLHFGPYVLYTSPSWDAYLDDDYSATKGTATLRQRLTDVQGLDDVVTLDYLTGYQMILVEMSSDVARAVVGMDMTTVQWETEGGMMLNFKVMCILLTQLRADSNGNTGIVHGTAA